MKRELYTRVALETDLPEYLLQRGDVATVVEFHAGRPDYNSEVFTATCEAVTVVTVRDSQIELLTSGEVPEFARSVPIATLRPVRCANFPY